MDCLPRMRPGTQGCLIEMEGKTLTIKIRERFRVMSKSTSKREWDTQSLGLPDGMRGPGRGDVRGVQYIEPKFCTWSPTRPLAPDGGGRIYPRCFAITARPHDLARHVGMRFEEVCTGFVNVLNLVEFALCLRFGCDVCSVCLCERQGRYLWRGKGVTCDMFGVHESFGAPHFRCSKTSENCKPLVAK